MITVHVLASGSTIVDEALPFSDRSKNPLAFTGLFRSKKHKVEVPVRAYLVSFPQGNILIDTGWDRAIRKNARKYEGFANHFASTGFLPEGEGVIEQLEKLHLSLKDIKAVYLTHLDIDHAGGLQEVKEVKDIYCSKAEKEAALKGGFRYRKKLWEGIDLKTFSDQEEVDFFREDTFVAIPMKGHSAGMTSYRIGTKENYVLIAGDAGYGSNSIEKQSLPGVEWNKEEEKKTLKKLVGFAKDLHCQDILMTHDKDEKKSVFTIE
ncbi:MAG: MBL fold metallo-hydrolase [Eubacteriales bacterium]|nr:MBL fold metallo-hydrolase [Eubacteriales bacterium]